MSLIGHVPATLHNDAGDASPARMPALVALAYSGGLTVIAALLGARASIEAASFYAGLAKPWWAPPAGVFGPVWTGLFIAMAVAAYQVACTPLVRATRVALLLFAVQLAVNALWSWLFFAWHKGSAAIIDAALLVAVVGLTVRRFWQIKRSAGILLVPYFLWATFALALTVAVVSRNRGTL